VVARRDRTGAEIRRGRVAELKHAFGRRQSRQRKPIKQIRREAFAKRRSDGITAMIMSAKKLQDKVAIITGASKGLGKAMALALAEAGAKLALVSRNFEQLKETAAAVREFGTDAEVFTADVTDEQQVGRAEASVIERFGKPQIVTPRLGLFQTTGH